jgi:hypothetical protein
MLKHRVRELLLLLHESLEFGAVGLDRLLSDLVVDAHRPHAFDQRISVPSHRVELLRADGASASAPLLHIHVVEVQEIFPIDVMQLFGEHWATHRRSPVELSEPQLPPNDMPILFLGHLQYRSQYG